MEKLAELEHELKRVFEVERQTKRSFREENVILKRTINQLEKDVASEQEQTYQQFTNLVSDHGGFSRLTIFNATCHSKHPNAAKLFWGYQTWKETKLYAKL